MRHQRWLVVSHVGEKLDSIQSNYSGGARESFICEGEH